MMLLAVLVQGAAAPAAAPPPVVTSAPSPAAAAMGERLARSGSIMALLPLVAAKDTDDLVAAHPDLSPAEQARLRATARTTLAAGMARIETAFGTAYAKRLTLGELTALVAAAERLEQQRLRAVQPMVMAEAIAALGALDFKKDVAAAFCRDTGKLCK
ncbi:hypothetical protein F1C10_11765 [Sphingomonas sp. NBWT7]|uniref:hypothetical protein n=1 Tax=Sphingomonas sp. NBWT7 TaxID=2596913 RepID=UPI001862C638|nr:hypothetical protein [Sphingomonas sp. NBWT7]QNE32555.1 hypothetical protein F1C10_11765 [Sphingomonas sp. NBWT7]